MKTTIHNHEGMGTEQSCEIHCTGKRNGQWRFEVKRDRYGIDTTWIGGNSRPSPEVKSIAINAAIESFEDRTNNA